MKAIDLVQFALRFTDDGLNRIVEDMRSRPLTRPAPGQGNHPMWIVGHLAFIEGALRSILLGEPHPLPHWAALFAPGTQPSDDPAAYPPFEEVLAKYREFRRDNLALLERVGDAGLDRKPVSPPPGFEAAMSTFGQTFLLIALHQMVHYGQIADSRRAAGLAPLV